MVGFPAVKTGEVGCFEAFFFEVLEECWVWVIVVASYVYSGRAAVMLLVSKSNMWLGIWDVCLLKLRKPRFELVVMVGTWVESRGDDRIEMELFCSADVLSLC